MKNSGVSRRRFLKSIGATGVAASALSAWPSRFAFAASGVANHATVVVFLRGAMDGLSTVIPIDESVYFDSRPDVAIPSTGRIDLNGQFAMHEAMSPLFDLYSQGDLALVHAAGLGPESSTRSHFSAQHLMEVGVDDIGTGTGWLGRSLSSNPDAAAVFASVGIGRVQQTLRGFGGTLGIANLSQFRLSPPASAGGAQTVDDTLTSMYGDVVHPTLRDQSIQAVDALGVAQMESLGSLPKPADYGDAGLGNSLHQVAELMLADVGLQAACIDMGGWDLHSAMGTWDTGRMRYQLAELSVSLAAFYNEVSSLRNSVTVVVMSEFGRRVGQNASGGTDHGKGGVMMVLGGGINGGTVYGDWPGLDNLDDGDLRTTTDYRLVLSEIVDRRLNNGDHLATIFPAFGQQPYLGIVS